MDYNIKSLGFSDQKKDQSPTAEARAQIDLYYE